MQLQQWVWLQPGCGGTSSITQRRQCVQEQRAGTGADTAAPAVPKRPQPASTPAHMALKTRSEHKLPSSGMLVVLFAKGWKKENILTFDYELCFKTRMIFQALLDCILFAFHKSTHLSCLNGIFFPHGFKHEIFFLKKCVFPLSCSLMSGYFKDLSKLHFFI